VVKRADQARHDLRQIRAFTARDPLHYAKKISPDILEKTTLLHDLPRMGRVAPEIGDEDVRELSLYS
jgi:toxin ParE1/3/4